MTVKERHPGASRASNQSNVYGFWLWEESGGTKLICSTQRAFYFVVFLFLTPIPWKKMCLHRKITWRFRRWNEQGTDARLVHDFLHSLSLSFRSKVAITTFKISIAGNSEGSCYNNPAISRRNFTRSAFRYSASRYFYPGHKRAEKPCISTADTRKRDGGKVCHFKCKTQQNAH